ncbi:MAG: hypothetical protein IJ916_04040 [Paludibacteraceae bacterium]|nr:hypothetical protein [Paludibacteraceae bacterium]
MTIKYVSTNHMRIENGVTVSHDYVPRYIILNYDMTGRVLSISIYPSLTDKKAVLVRDSNNVLYYQGDDPDFRFEVETWPDNNTIKRVSVVRVDRNLEIRYLGEHEDAL